jgi:hypothetical protein
MTLLLGVWLGKVGSSHCLILCPASLPPLVSLLLAGSHRNLKTKYRLSFHTLTDVHLHECNMNTKLTQTGGS